MAVSKLVGLGCALRTEVEKGSNLHVLHFDKQRKNNFARICCNAQAKIV